MESKDMRAVENTGTSSEIKEKQYEKYEKFVRRVGGFLFSPSKRRNKGEGRLE
jgi:hypothetical protein